MAATTIDHESELVIFQLLADDLRAVSPAEDAEQIQIKEIITSTTTGTESVHTEVDKSPSDEDIALGLFAVDAQIARDQAYAELLQSQESSFAISRQYAQRLAASERRLQDEEANNSDDWDDER
jgi:hypothetical protein